MITIGFTSGKSIYSRVISWFTGSKRITHVYIAFDVDDVLFPDKHLFQVESGGVNILNYNSAKKYFNYNREFVIPFENESELQTVQFLIKRYLNLEYDWSAIVRIAIGVIYKFITGKEFKLKNPFKNYRKIICSEMGVNVIKLYLRDNDAYDKQFADAKLVTPYQLYKYITEQTSFTENENERIG